MDFVKLSRGGQSNIEDDDDDAEFAAHSAYSHGVARGQLADDARSRELWVQRELAREGSIAAHLARTPVSRGVSRQDRESLARVFAATVPAATPPPRRRDVATVERRGPRSSEELIASLEALSGLPR